MSTEEALDEITANACEMMLKDSEFITKLSTEQPDLFTRIKEKIDEIVNKIKEAFKGIRGTSPAYNALEKLETEWSGIQKLWDDAAVEGSKEEQGSRKGRKLTGKGSK